MIATGNSLRIAIPALALMTFAGVAWTEAEAITYGQEDCEDNATNLNCDHPNTVSLSGFREPRPGEPQDVLVSFLRCSGSLLSKDDERIVILTAGHCASGYLDSLQSGAIVDVGVSFDALIDRDVSEELARWSPTQYILGGQPVLPAAFTQSAKFDYAVIVFDISGSGLAGLETTDGTPVDLADVDEVTLPPLNYLKGLVSATNPLILTAVGYGDGEAHNKPGAGGNAGGVVPDPDKLGVRWVAEHTSAFHLMGRRGNLLFGSQNPARGDNGTCFGDSGGPLFVDDSSIEIQVGVTSAGDAVCRASSIMARTDGPDAQAFLSCVGTGATIDDILDCGCTEVTSQGVCPDGQ